MRFKSMSDRAVLREIGRRLRRRRLDRNISQATIAAAAGLNRTTVGQLERDGSASMLTLVQVLRAMASLDELDAFLPDQGPSPLELARHQGKTRRRASRRPLSDDQGDQDW